MGKGNATKSGGVREENDERKRGRPRLSLSLPNPKKDMHWGDGQYPNGGNRGGVKAEGESHQKLFLVGEFHGGITQRSESKRRGDRGERKDPKSREAEKREGAGPSRERDSGESGHSLMPNVSKRKKKENRTFGKAGERGEGGKTRARFIERGYKTSSARGDGGVQEAP